MVKVFVPRERAEGETRVAATPETVKRLVKEGLSVKIEAGAGERAHLSDAAYEQAGATLVQESGLAAAFAEADAVLKVRSEEHTSELQSRPHLVCRLLLEK